VIRLSACCSGTAPTTQDQNRDPGDGGTEEREQMKIQVNRIPFEGVREETTYDPKALDIERFDAHLEDPITLSSFISRAEGALVVQADIQGVVQLHCARCLATFERPLHTKTILSYEVAPTDVVDITEDIRQEIILAYPMIPICQEDCKGLCSVCGENLNVRSCPHQTP